MNVLTANQVAERLGYPARRVELYRSGQFPAPIDLTLHAVPWRWLIAAIEAYEAGEWK